MKLRVLWALPLTLQGAALFGMAGAVSGCTFFKSSEKKSEAQSTAEGQGASPEGAAADRKKRPESAKSSDKPSGGGGGGSRRGGRGPTVVTLLTAEKKVMARTLQTVVTLVGRQQTEVYPKVAGRISWLGSNEGQPVRAGQTLFKIDRQEPGESFLSVPVVSPISGWVGRWNVTLGTQVGLGDPVLLVVDDSALRSTIYLPVEEWSKIKRSTKISLTIDGKIYAAKVETIARAAESGSGRGSFVAEVPNPKHELRSGMVATASIALEPQERMIVPSNALRISDQGAFVFLAEGEKAKRANVKYAVLSNDEVELISGVQPGAQIIIAGNNMVSDGSAIKIPAATQSEKSEKSEKTEGAETQGNKETKP